MTKIKLEYLFKQFETILGGYKQSEEKATFIVGLNALPGGVVLPPSRQHRRRLKNSIRPRR